MDDAQIRDLRNHLTEVEWMLRRARLAIDARHMGQVRQHLDAAAVELPRIITRIDGVKEKA